MASTVRFASTVCNGFPVDVEAEICPAEPDVGIFHRYAEVSITGSQGQPIPFIEKKMTAADWAKLELEALDG